MLIGLTGLQGSGKDTVANILVDKFGFSHLSFAEALKVMRQWNLENEINDLSWRDKCAIVLPARIGMT